MGGVPRQTEYPLCERRLRLWHVTPVHYTHGRVAKGRQQRMQPSRVHRFGIIGKEGDDGRIAVLHRNLPRTTMIERCRGHAKQAHTWRPHVARTYCTTGPHYQKALGSCYTTCSSIQNTAQVWGATGGK